ncbi:YfbK domain-containing protein [Mucilaginibacter sp. UYCu711]|uniref:vWA domain-containing protein n=1 Tax=Mucilaginibacter sp. UYCu711 TaxID=3156339 RepID=UPI003D1D1BA4
MRKYFILLAALVSFTGVAAPVVKTSIVISSHHNKLITVTGKIVDGTNGRAVVGATIGTDGKGLTQSDVDGKYTVVVNNGATLVFISLGYTSQSIKLKPNQTVLNVSLVADSKSLNEVVIRGYVKRNRDETTGSSYIVTGKEVQDNPVGNVEQLLQGKVAGANTQNFGAVGMRGTVNIRGLAAQSTYGYTAPRVSATPGTESYGHINENQFIDPKSTPLSTFAVDVDAASYANVRRFINAGQLPPKNAVRIEEMINYFKYNLPEPTSGEPVAIQTELAAAPWNPQHQLVRIGLKAKNVKLDKLPPSNLVFLIDVSGSMSEPNKLPLVKTSMKMLVDQLRPIDNVAIVTYAGSVGVRLESTPASDKQKIKDVIDQLGAGGSTAGGAGIMMAYDIAKKNFLKKGNNRIILATDGDFNVGPSTNKDMKELIEEERGSGVSLSILGFGMGNYKDSKMELLADKGHGNYAYIDNITEATKSMVTEFGGTLFTVAKDVKLQVEFNPGKVQAYRLLGYEDRLMAKEDFNNDTKLGGDMGVGHTVTALYEIIPVGVKDSFTGSVDPLKYQKTEEAVKVNTSSEVMTIKFRYKQPDGDKSKMELVTVKDKPLSQANTSTDFRFAAAVAEYGMLLRDSQFKQDSKIEQVITMAKKAKGDDDNGYRAEFIRLAESTRDMMKTTAVTAAK